MPHNETELIALCKKGDRQAFNELVLIHQSRIMNIAFGMLSNTDDAADAAQEVFIKVFRNIGGFKEQSSFSTWIYRITVNVCNDILRKNNRHKTVSLNMHFDDEEHEFDIKDTSMTPDELVHTAELQNEIRYAISKLKPEYKAVITLYDIEGLPYDKISEILKIPMGTVKSRLSRARTALKKELTKKRNFFD